MAWACPVCALKQDAFSFGFLSGFKWGFPICLRGPSGLSPTIGTSIKENAICVTPNCPADNKDYLSEERSTKLLSSFKHHESKRKVGVPVDPAGLTEGVVENQLDDDEFSQNGGRHRCKEDEG
jgi:rubredoxin